jgi:hypothetical protein
MRHILPDAGDNGRAVSASTGNPPAAFVAGPPGVGRILAQYGRLLAADEAAKAPIRREAAMDARDAWIYEQCCALTRYATIINEVRVRWTDHEISTVQGVKDAAAAWATRNALPTIPRRKRGRPRRT